MAAKADEERYRLLFVDLFTPAELTPAELVLMPVINL